MQWMVDDIVMANVHNGPSISDLSVFHIRHFNSREQLQWQKLNTSVSDISISFQSHCVRHMIIVHCWIGPYTPCSQRCESQFMEVRSLRYPR